MEFNQNVGMQWGGGGGGDYVVKCHEQGLAICKMVGVGVLSFVYSENRNGHF